jgi:HEAT repeat protein
VTDPTREAYELLAQAANAGEATPAAAARLAALGTAAIEPINEALALRDPAARRLAVLGLSMMRERGVIAPLLNFCDGAGPREQDLVAIAVRGAIPVLVPDDAPRLREFVARHAGHADPLTRAAVCDLVAAVEDRAALELLVRLARDPHPFVTERADGALVALFGDGPDSPRWRALLGHGDPQQRARAADEVRGHSDAGAILTATLQSGDASAVHGVAEAAGDDPDDAMRAALAQLAADPATPAPTFATALRALRPSTASDLEAWRPVLERGLGSPDPAARAAAAGALVCSPIRDAIRLGARGLADPDLHVVEATAAAWAAAGGRVQGLLVPAAVDALERLGAGRLHDPGAWPAAGAILRALLAAHLGGVPSEDAAVAAAGRWAWCPNPRTAALARRVHEALNAPPPREEQADDDPILAALRRGHDDDIRGAVEALAALPDAAIPPYAEALLDAMHGSDDDALVALCVPLGRTGSERSRAFLARLRLHPSTAVRRAAEAAATP